MNAAVYTQQAVPLADKQSAPEGMLAQYDPWLLTAVLATICIGLVMVASASVTVADRNFGEPFHYLWRQMFATGLGLSLGLVAMKTPLEHLQQASSLFLFLALFMLTLVLIPGLGREINGSMRWVFIGPISLQASEPVKLCVIIYLAGYLVRHGEQVRTAFIGFIKPVGVLTVIAGLLLLEPDFGATVVLFATTLGMLFLAGVSLTRFTAWGLVAVAALSSLAIQAPYRMTRLMTFMDPWADPFDSGFQLTQALIAFGRGEWFGVGLGSSIQKLFYLPEAHTDFIYAVIAEEFGFLGCISIILLAGFILWRAFHIAALAEKAGLPFQAYLAYGIGLLFGLQAFINMGVNMGVLPTKGLTLPLISYGSNSMIVFCIGVGLLLRVYYEAHKANNAVSRRGGRYEP